MLGVRLGVQQVVNASGAANDTGCAGAMVDAVLAKLRHKIVDLFAVVETGAATHPHTVDWVRRARHDDDALLEVGARRNPTVGSRMIDDTTRDDDDSPWKDALERDFSDFHQRRRGLRPRVAAVRRPSGRDAPAP